MGPPLAQYGLAGYIPTPVLVGLATKWTGYDEPPYFVLFFDFIFSVHLLQYICCYLSAVICVWLFKDDALVMYVAVVRSAKRCMGGDIEPVGPRAHMKVKGHKHRHHAILVASVALKADLGAEVGVRGLAMNPVNHLLRSGPHVLK